ncbi:FAD-binding oxidoreductase [Qipengyuania sp. MTN3-11]|uniref:FAD-binding oxidoreductase n=1 Tax=Qipengyuania sp. MTN3-11 TaxID=3056557 RepID=UPI0036F434A7
MSESFVRSISERLGPRGFTNDPELVDPWLTDWRGRYTGKAIGLASPANTSEVAAVMKLCAAHGVPVVPQGGNSGMSGGATPDTSGTALVLSLRRMDTIRSFDPDGFEITCDAGVILQTLHETVEAAGRRFPLTLGGKGSATIGGLISTNAGGTQVLRHGTMRAQVLGLEAVLADGRIIDMLTPLKKDNRGFDLKQVLIGSEGTLGIVTAATLRLLPAIGERAVMWAGLDSIGAARRFLLHCEKLAGDKLEGFEVLQSHSLSAVLDHVPHTRSPLRDDHSWHALVELVADREGETDLQSLAETLLESAFDDGLVEDATIAANETQAEAFWLIRESIAPAERSIGPAMQHDVSVPVARMAEFVDQAISSVETRFPAHRAIAFGHLGDGNVHFHVLAPPDADRLEWERDCSDEIAGFVYDLVDQCEGSISAEHGIGQVKVGELERLGDPVALSMQRAIKSALDPRGILNPGKLLALEGAVP